MFNANYPLPYRQMHKTHSLKFGYFQPSLSREFESEKRLGDSQNDTLCQIKVDPTANTIKHETDISSCFNNLHLE